MLDGLRFLHLPLWSCSSRAVFVFIVVQIDQFKPIDLDMVALLGRYFFLLEVGINFASLSLNLNCLK